MAPARRDDPRASRTRAMTGPSGPPSQALLSKLRRIGRLADGRLAAYVTTRLIEHARAAFNDLERTLAPDTDPTTAEIVRRDRVVAPILTNVRLREGVTIGARSRILVRANRPGDPYGRVDVGPGVRLGQNTYTEVYTGNHVSIGEFTTVGDSCAISGDVQIGRNCFLSWNIYLTTGDHHVRETPEWLIRDQDARAQLDPLWSTKFSLLTRVDDDVWIGWGAFIKQGVRIGRGAFIGAYAVVTHDVPPYTIHAGMPARQIGRRLNFAPPRALDAGDLAHRPYFYSGFLHRQVDLPPTGSLLAGQKVEIVLEGGRFARLAISARATSRPIVLRATFNAIPIGDIQVSESRSTFTLALPPGAFEASRRDILASHNVVELEAVELPPELADARAIMELFSASIEAT
jgi:acetyltransferase-like isoleucine patch superfamily enzyme